MRNSALFTTILALFAAISAAQQTPTPNPPVAKKIRVEKPINGTTLVDDYGWLRDRKNAEVRQYLEAENAYAEAMTENQKPFAEALYNETLSHIKQTDTTAPYRKYGYWYYSRTEEGKQYVVLC